jgi:hypothetical protein
MFGRRTGQVAIVVASFALLGIEAWTAWSELDLRGLPRLGWWIIPIAALSSAFLGRWHYVSGHTWATPERRATLWEKECHKWSFDDLTGEWHKIVAQGVGRTSYIVSSRSRESRLVDEHAGFEKRIAACTVAHFLGVMLLLASLDDYVAFLHNHGGEVFATFFVFGLICESFAWGEEWAYRSGMPVWIDPTTRKWDFGALVYDPPAAAPNRKPYGESSPISPSGTTSETDYPMPA